MDIWSVIIWIIIIILGTIIVQYLFNPYFNKLGIPKEQGETEKKSEVDKKKEEEFYREIWTAKKRKRS